MEKKLFYTLLVFIVIFSVRSMKTQTKSFEEYEYGSVFFEELSIASSQIDTSGVWFYKYPADNSLTGDIRYKLKDGWELTEIRIYRRDPDNTLGMFYGAFEETEVLTDLSNINFGEYATHLYIFIENASQKRKARLFISLERFDELVIDFDSLILNKSYISLKNKNAVYDFYYSDEKTSLSYFTSPDSLVAGIEGCAHAALSSETYLSDDNILTAEYQFSGNILKLKIAKSFEAESAQAVIDGEEKINCLIKN